MWYMWFFFVWIAFYAMVSYVYDVTIEHNISHNNVYRGEE